MAIMMNEAEFAEYVYLSEVVKDEFTLDYMLPDAWSAAALVGAAAEQAARVFYIVVGELYYTKIPGAVHGEVDGVCAACGELCETPQAAANVARFRAMIPRLEELSRSAEAV